MTSWTSFSVDKTKVKEANQLASKERGIGQVSSLVDVKLL